MRKALRDGICQRPDRDAPKLVCGYPLPCPWHTGPIAAAIRRQRPATALVSRRKRKAVGRGE